MLMILEISSMTSKRQRARAALLEWNAKTTPEMFVEEHKGIIFAGTDKSPKVEIVDEKEHLFSSILERFQSLTQRECSVKAKRIKTEEASFVDYLQVANSSHIIESLSSQIIEAADAAALELNALTGTKYMPDEYNLKDYDDLLTQNLSKTPLRC